ncbi:MAG: LptA/OstA family protein [Hyphomonadaceae bacterium]|nr:LptA/OstA family protein [Hyphomonadaceae bacterium]
MKHVSILALAAAVLIATPAFAQIGGRGDAPVEVKSDKGEYLQNEGKFIYSGDVVATQADSRITTDTLTAFCTRATPPPGERIADQPCEEIRQLVAEGNVIYTAPDVTIRGDKAEYDYPTDTITITGDVILSRGKEGVVQGTKVVYQVAEGKTAISAGSNRVLSILTPSKGNKSQAPAPVTPN